MSVTPATPGDQFTTTIGHEREEHTFTVCESCGSNDGQWYCVTHDALFAHNLAKDSHIDDGGQHVLAWVCYEHGPETP